MKGPRSFHGHWQGPLPKGWSPKDRYINDRVVAERLAYEDRTGLQWSPVKSAAPSAILTVARTALQAGADAYCRTCWGKGEAGGDTCWTCDGTGIDAPSVIIRDHIDQINAGIVDRYIARAAE